MCQVQPLSTTKLVRRCPFRRCLLLRAAFRRTRVAAMACAHVAKGADMRLCACGHSAAPWLVGGADAAHDGEKCEIS
eukprot:760447-Pleurochrysis_carterae.AAC.1